MPNRLRAAKLVLGVAAALLSAILLGSAAVGAEPLAAAKPTATCSVAGLHYAEKQGGVTYGVAVVNLKAAVTPCAKARSLAATVAKDVLHGTKVPARIGGLKVTAKEPCAGCTPNTSVSARSGQELVTFTVKGGV
jgi:hypothetical protein